MYREPGQDGFVTVDRDRRRRFTRSRSRARRLGLPEPQDLDDKGLDQELIKLVEEVVRRARQLPNLDDLLNQGDHQPTQWQRGHMGDTGPRRRIRNARAQGQIGDVEEQGHIGDAGAQVALLDPPVAGLRMMSYLEYCNTYHAQISYHFNIYLLSVYTLIIIFSFIRLMASLKQRLGREDAAIIRETIIFCINMLVLVFVIFYWLFPLLLPVASRVAYFGYILFGDYDYDVADH